MILNNTFIKNNNLYTLFLGIFITTFFTDLSAQVQFKLEKLADGETFQVSMLPMQSWDSPMNITSTAQVTLKVPTNSFEIMDLVSVQSNVNWEYNSKTTAPDEAPEFDYLSIGLTSMGTKQFHYQEGQSIPLFTFKNAEPCQGSITLMDRDDPFSAPNSKKANVGNSITVFGAKGEAYQQNLAAQAIPCGISKLTSSNEAILPAFSAPKLYPNPAIDQVAIEFQWELSASNGTLAILDFNGRTVLKQAISLRKGANEIEMDIKNLPSGLFTVELRSQEKSMILDRLVKKNR